VASLDAIVGRDPDLGELELGRERLQGGHDQLGLVVVHGDDLEGDGHLLVGYGITGSGGGPGRDRPARTEKNAKPAATPAARAAVIGSARMSRIFIAARVPKNWNPARAAAKMNVSRV